MSNADADASPGDLPPEPTARAITPAPEDFAGPAPAGAWVWPLLWAALVALLTVALS